MIGGRERVRQDNDRVECDQGHWDIPFLGVKIPIQLLKNSHYRKTRLL